MQNIYPGDLVEINDNTAEVYNWIYLSEKNRTQIEATKSYFYPEPRTFLYTRQAAIENAKNAKNAKLVESFHYLAVCVAHNVDTEEMLILVCDDVGWVDAKHLKLIK